MSIITGFYCPLEVPIILVGEIYRRDDRRGSCQTFGGVWFYHSSFV